jgi:hypothetical protein
MLADSISFVCSPGFCSFCFLFFLSFSHVSTSSSLEAWHYVYWWIYISTRGRYEISPRPLLHVIGCKAKNLEKIATNSSDKLSSGFLQGYSRPTQNHISQDRKWIPYPRSIPKGG